MKYAIIHEGVVQEVHIERPMIQVPYQHTIDVPITGKLVGDKIEIEETEERTISVNIMAPNPAMTEIPDDVFSEYTANDDGTYTAPTPPPRVVPHEAVEHVLVLKVGYINQTRTDGLIEDVSPLGLQRSMDKYSNIAIKLNSKVALGETLTAEEQATLIRIRDGSDFFDAVDAAAEIIGADPDAADPIGDDERWPELPS